MKIIQITPSFYPSKGGVETHVKKVSEELVELGHEVEVITKLTVKSEKLKVKVKNNSVCYLDVKGSGLSYKLSIWRQMWRLKPVLDEADVIQVHDVAWWLLPLWPFIRKKIFITFHGWEGVYPVPKRNIIQRRFFSHLARGVVHVGAFIQKFYGDKPDLVVYGAVDDDLRFKINPSASAGSKQLRAGNLRLRELRQVVFIGRLERVNEIELYLNFVKKLKKLYPLVEMTWVGDGSYKRHCQRLGVVTGMVDEAKLTAYLKQADLILASSYLSILQALNLGKLVVAFYSNPLKASYLKDSPMARFMIIADSPEQAVKVLQSSKLPDVGKGRKWAEKQTWEKIAKRYLQLYKDKGLLVNN